MVTHDGNLCMFRTVCGEAEQVFLVGDFNNWSTTAHAMDSDGRGTWRAALRLTPGTYRFAYFIIHGRSHDPAEGLTAIRVDPTDRTVCVPARRMADTRTAAAC